MAAEEGDLEECIRLGQEERDIRSRKEGKPRMGKEGGVRTGREEN